MIYQKVLKFVWKILRIKERGALNSPPSQARVNLALYFKVRMSIFRPVLLAPDLHNWLQKHAWHHVISKELSATVNPEKKYITR